jgi:radical SAM protein with 4Fe4S-binding SPASM domain
MSVDLFRQVLGEVAPFTKLVALHLMGDPLVHPELGQMIELCQERGVRVFLVTNGILLREQQVEWLLHPAIRQVNFSLHSFRDNFPTREMGPYLERIFRFTERAFEERPRLFINYRLWNLSDARGKEAENVELLEKIEERFGAKIPREIDTRVAKNYVVKNYLSLHFDTEFTWPSLDLPVLGETGTCQGLNSHFGVLVDGTVVPCCLDKEGTIALGKIPQQPLREILRGARAQALITGFRRHQLVEALCQRCQYLERFQSGPAIA